MPATEIKIEMYTGEELTCSEGSSPALIEGILWEDDFIMLLGSEKAGKSILALQMAHCLTTGNTFLDKYRVPVPVQVLYIQTEGKRHQTIDRMERMQNTIEVDKFRFIHVHKKFLPMDTEEYFATLVARIDSCPIKPKVIFIDALYMAMAGNLIDNKDARVFLSRVAYLMDRYHATIVLVHHESRPAFDEKTHEEIDRADKGSYGSVFFRAIVDHILYLKMNRDRSRTLTCNTQRSGEVMSKEDLILVEPDPLCFEIKGDYKAYEEVVKHCVFKNPGLSIDRIIDRVGLSGSSVSKALCHLFRDKVITKIPNTHPPQYIELKKGS